jgi:hypothetical protein
LGCSSQTEEQNVHLRNPVGHWLEGASQHQPVTLIPIQHPGEEKKIINSYANTRHHFYLQLHKANNAITSPTKSAS